MVPAALLPSLRRARDLADRGYADPLDLAMLAAAANVSKYHFARCFTETYRRDQPDGHGDLHARRLLEPRLLLVALP